MTKILHMKITEGASCSDICMWHENAKKLLGDQCILITSPYELSSVDGNDKIIKIDAREYSYNELMDAIEKAEKYYSGN